MLRRDKLCAALLFSLSIRRVVATDNSRVVDFRDSINHQDFCHRRRRRRRRDVALLHPRSSSIHLVSATSIRFEYNPCTICFHRRVVVSAACASASAPASASVVENRAVGCRDCRCNPEDIKNIPSCWAIVVRCTVKKKNCKGKTCREKQKGVDSVSFFPLLIFIIILSGWAGGS